MNRKLTTTELEALAWVFAVSNLGQADVYVMGEPIKGTKVKLATSERSPGRLADTPVQLGHAAYAFLQGTAEDDEMWAGFEAEYKSWRKGLRTTTLAEVAKTWHDMAPLMQWFGRHYERYQVRPNCQGKGYRLYFGDDFTVTQVGGEVGGKVYRTQLAAKLAVPAGEEFTIERS